MVHLSQKVPISKQTELILTTVSVKSVTSRISNQRSARMGWSTLLKLQYGFAPVNGLLEPIPLNNDFEIGQYLRSLPPDPEEPLNGKIDNKPPQ